MAVPSGYKVGSALTKVAYQRLNPEAELCSLGYQE